MIAFQQEQSFTRKLQRQFRRGVVAVLEIAENNEYAVLIEQEKMLNQDIPYFSQKLSIFVPKESYSRVFSFKMTYAVIIIDK
ncbi:MAG: hypothetical protein RRX92_02025 [Lachnospiraceae bacterium]